MDGRVTYRLSKKRTGRCPRDGLEGSRSWRGVRRDGHKFEWRNLCWRVESTSGKQKCRDDRDLPKGFHGAGVVGDGKGVSDGVEVDTGTLVSVGAVVTVGTGDSVGVEVGDGVRLGVAVGTLGILVMPGVRVGTFGTQSS